MRPRSLPAAAALARVPAGIAIMAALVHRTVAGGSTSTPRYEACALTTESAIANYIYQENAAASDRSASDPADAHAVPRQRRHAARWWRVGYPRYIKGLADLLDGYGMAGDLRPQVPGPGCDCGQHISHHH
jgi:hypothetical protein